MKHDSCAELHIENFDTFVSCGQYREAAKTPDGQVKPLAFMSANGGPNKAPKNQQTMAAGICHFTAFDLDVLFIFAHSPRSRVEGRIVPLSKLLLRSFLPFETFWFTLSIRQWTKSPRRIN